MNLFKNQKGFSIIGMIISSIVVSLLFFYAMQFYFKSSPSGKKMKEALAEQGIKTDNYVEMIQSAKEKAGELSEIIKKREQMFEEMDKQ